MKLEELKVYELAMDLGETVWQTVLGWDYFAKDTLGKQLTKSTDSIAVNISEGYGRFHYKENINFCYFARGSLFETKTWLVKAYKRNLIDEIVYKSVSGQIIEIGKLLNGYIKSIGKSNNELKEPASDYETDNSPEFNDF